jgi:hypothetical protein
MVISIGPLWYGRYKLADVYVVQRSLDWAYMNEIASDWKKSSYAKIDWVTDYQCGEGYDS